jgi:hypothetical protein
MNETPDYSRLFESFQIAGRAFNRLQLIGSDIADQELARNPDYLKLHRAGMQIAIIGGRAAINGAIESICREKAERRDAARKSLERMWFGMGHWRA